MNTLARQWRNFRSTRGVKRELITVVLCLLLGVLLVPALLYVVAQPVLGPYANGGYLRLMGDLFRALAVGSLPFWLFVLGPYVAVWVWRIWRWSWRAD